LSIRIPIFADSGGTAYLLNYELRCGSRLLVTHSLSAKVGTAYTNHSLYYTLTLSIFQDNYKNCLSRAKRALSAGSFPAETLQAIEEDILSTLSGLHIFHPETGPLYQDLKDMLCAWIVSRSDEGLGYVHGTAKIAGMILLNMKPQQGFVVMRNLLERHCMRSFYGSVATKDDVSAAVWFESESD
jgi:hypothetical protein